MFFLRDFGFALFSLKRMNNTRIYNKNQVCRVRRHSIYLVFMGNEY
ncbi:hypothetical protein GCM10007342_10740 [Staphylococcus pragensis]|nr:hypothetical protein GCM10007342_10740 [Staphylococcus pragensis]